MNAEPARFRLVEIQRATAEAFGTPLEEMWSERRGRRVARPRQVAMYLARELTSYSLMASGSMQPPSSLPLLRRHRDGGDIGNE
jgi:chromosomal replication initiator protein